MQSHTRRPQSILYVLLLSFCIFSWIILFTRLSFDFHAGMRTNRSDLGQIAQSVWNSSRARLLENTDAGFIATRLTDHVEPLLVLISPLFWLWNDLRVLLLLQVVAVGCGAYFVFRIAYCVWNRANQRSLQDNINESANRNSLFAIPFAFAYLLAPQLQHAVMTEFHAAPLAVPLILWALWAVEARRTRQFVIAALLVACVKEEMAIAAAGLGVWAIYRGWRLEIRDWRLHTGNRRSEIGDRRAHNPQFLRHLVILSSCHLVTLLCLAWFIIATFVIVPANAPLVYTDAQSVYFQRFGPLGNSPVSILRTLLTDPVTVWSVLSQPARLDYLWGLLAPLGFLSLLAPELLIVALPLIVANLFSTYPGQYYNEFHYSAPIMPYVVVSAILGTQRLFALLRWMGLRLWKDNSSRYNSQLVIRNSQFVLAIWLLSWNLIEYRDHGRGPLGGRYDPITISAHHRLIDRFVAQIPADAILTATSAVHPHGSLRRFVYQFPLGLDAPTPDEQRATWALLDVTTKTDMAPGDLKARVDQLLAADWGVVDGADGFLLLRQGAASKTIPKSFFDFTRILNPSPDLLRGRSSARLVGTESVDWARWRETNVVTDWQIGMDFDHSSGLPHFRIVTPGEVEVYNSRTLPTPAHLWLNAEQLQPDKLLRLTTLALYLPRTWAVVSEGEADLPAAYIRTDGRHLIKLPADLMMSEALGDQLTALTGWQLTSNSANFDAAGKVIQFQSWLRKRPSWAGDTVDLWLQWRTEQWVTGWTVFVHLRHNGENRAQADGDPRWFARYSTNTLLQNAGLVNDWRQLAIPTDAAPGTVYDVVIGLYNPASGQRADLLDANRTSVANEFVIGTVTIGAPPIPDQTCAMIPESCAAQQ